MSVCRRLLKPQNSNFRINFIAKIYYFSATRFLVQTVIQFCMSQQQQPTEVLYYRSLSWG